jgi:hypothetical protein
VHIASFFSGGFITAIVVNPPERKLAKRTSVDCMGFRPDLVIFFSTLVCLIILWIYGKVASFNMSRLEAHAGFFRLLMKENFYPYVL